MQYVFSMTSRMVTIALGCALLLCVLLFALGFEIGARFVAPPRRLRYLRRPLRHSPRRPITR
jgi:hypothetical protein